MGDEGWQVLRERPGARLVHLGPLVCVHFTAPPSLEDLRADFDAEDELIAREGELTQVVVFEAARIGRLPPENRAHATERLRRWGPRLRCSALVLLGDGLGTRMMRVALMTITAFSKTSDRHRIFEALDPAVHWVRDWPGQPALVASATAEELTRRFGVPER